MTTNRYLAVTTLVAAMLVLPRAAEAAKITLPSAGKALIGMVTIDGQAWMGFQPSGGGACTFWPLGGTSGLNDNYTIVGSTGNDKIYAIASGSVSFCTFTFTPILPNGKQLNVDGSSGDDVLMGRANHLNGGSGTDAIQGHPGVTWEARGGKGSDFIYSGGSTSSGPSTLMGDGAAPGEGDDLLCTSSGSPYFQGDFTTDWDTGCGAHTAAYSIESLNPPDCQTTCSALAFYTFWF